MNMIEVNGLRKSFGELEVLKDISFTAQKSDVIAVIGSSGSGKSTMLRCLIDLEKCDGGTILVEGDPLVSNGVYANAGEIKKITSKMGMVFQSFNLFPHYTVRQNLIKPARMVKKMDLQEAEERCEELLGKVGLTDKANEYPSRLSGGQKQRVAIARSLMLSPDILLFDEPTSALDPQLTGEVMAVIQQLAEEQMTMLVVTHEMGFAKNVANKVLFMHDGRICDEGTPQEVLISPRNKLVADFIGNGL